MSTDPCAFLALSSYYGNNCGSKGEKYHEDGEMVEQAIKLVNKLTNVHFFTVKLFKFTRLIKDITANNIKVHNRLEKGAKKYSSSVHPHWPKFAHEGFDYYDQK